jgi:cystathionine beta-synthase
VSARFTAKGKIGDSILDTVGCTPLVRLRSLTSPADATLWAKLEWFNPGGSVKDRAALEMIEDAERRGVLKPNATLVESTSGNLGVALGIVAAVKGYRVICVCDREMPERMRNKFLAHGIEIELLDRDFPSGYDTVRERYRRARELAAEISGAVMLNQYDNPANPGAHYSTTGPEIWDQTEGRLDAVVVSVGTCGTATGVARALKERRRDIRVIAADPVGSTLFDGEAGPFFQHGAGNVMRPGNFVPELIDECYKVSDREAFAAARHLARTEGILAGASSGGVLFAAQRAARKLGSGRLVVAVLPDSGERYLDELYSDRWMIQHGLLEQ